MRFLRTFSQTAVCLWLLVAATRVCWSQDAAPKIPVPDEATAKEALRVVVELYKSDYEHAKSADQKRALARKLLDTANDTKSDPVGRYVALRVAKDMAAVEGDLKVAFEAVGRLVAEYDVDELSLRTAVITEGAKAVRIPLEEEEFCREVELVIEQCIQADRYDLARSLGEVALSSSRKAKNAELTRAIVRRNKEVVQIENEFASIKSHLEVLEDEPTEAEANRKVGAFRCFMKGDWNIGITFLALGDDETFKALAVAELSEIPDAMMLGDDWWELADDAEGIASGEMNPVYWNIASREMKIHAVDWYRKALPTSEGLAKAKAESRVVAAMAKGATAETSEAAPSVSDLAGVNLTGTWKSIATNNYFYIRDSENNITVELQSGTTVESFTGVLVREGNRLTSSRWECVFKVDPSKHVRQGSFKGVITNPNRIAATIIKFEFDKEGNITRTAEGRTVWVRQPTK